MLQQNIKVWSVQSSFLIFIMHLSHTRGERTLCFCEGSVSVGEVKDKVSTPFFL